MTPQDQGLPPGYGVGAGLLRLTWQEKDIHPTFSGLTLKERLLSSSSRISLSSQFPSYFESAGLGWGKSSSLQE